MVIFLHRSKKFSTYVALVTAAAVGLVRLLACVFLDRTIGGCYRAVVGPTIRDADWVQR